MNIIELMHTVGIETFIVAFEEIDAARRGLDDGYGALGTILGDLDLARGIICHLLNIYR